ncbi:unnamed protein product [Cladocopium goreaui]|uniref:Uncharacterized protein n=1 Tax=Cladocopium goreaui TaxID=2562237 RepID=A0A9P1GM60_9DINO|nr:unnamed protein product [Cladocopium goreaui]
MLVTEVACSDAIRQARVTRVQSRGLKMSKRVNLKRSESGTHTVFKKFGQSIDVKISTTDLPTKMSFPYVKFSSWLRYIVEYDNLDCLVGTGDVEKMRPVLTTFWKRFEALYPHHVICDRAEGDRDFHRSMCIPVLYHGDEGRGLKKKQLMVLSTHGCLGKGNSHSNLGKTQAELENPDGPLRANMLGNTFCNHFLQCVMPISLYGEAPEAFEHMLQLQADEFAKLFWDGIVIQNQRFFIACVGIKGDSPFVQKSGLFDRSFTRRPRAPTSRTAAVGICHRCLAGKENYQVNGVHIDVPYEELGVETPMWRGTIGVTPPYSAPSPLLNIPYERSGDQTGMWKFDLFHSFHSGVGKYFASSVVVVCLELIDASIDESLRIISSDFLEYCKREKESPYHKKITKALLGIEHSFKDCPDGGWTKGDFTRVMCQWFDNYASRKVVGKTAEAAVTINLCLGNLYREGLFIRSADAERIGKQGLLFLQLYAELAQMAFDRRLKRFPLVPKLHYLHHQFLELVLDSRRAEWCLNIIMTGVQLEEDYIGRPSRLARRVSSRTTALRVIQRSFLAVRNALSEGIADDS